VVIGHRRKGGVSKTRIGEILCLDAAPHLEELRRTELVYTTPGKELNWWRPTPEALLALGLRSTSEIPALKELERWFDSQSRFLERDFRQTLQAEQCFAVAHKMDRKSIWPVCVTAWHAPV